MLFRRVAWGVGDVWARGVLTRMEGDADSLACAGLECSQSGTGPGRAGRGWWAARLRAAVRLF